MLPGGRSVLYTIWNNTGFEGGRIVMQPLAGGSPTLLVERGSYGRVVARDGIAFLVYARPEGLMAAPFDLEGGRVTGAPELVQPGVQVNLSGGAHFSVSADGVLAYVPGGLTEGDKTMLWVDTSGKTTELPPMPGVGFQYRLSPDGTKLARPNAAGADGDAAGANRDLWIDDLTGRSASIRLTFDRGHEPADLDARWQPRHLYERRTSRQPLLARRRRIRRRGAADDQPEPAESPVR